MFCVRQKSREVKVYKMSCNRIDFLGAQIDALTMNQTLSLVEERMSANLFTQHVVVNVAKLVAMQDDENIRNDINACEIINADGMGVVWGANLLKKPLPERVAGIDLFWNLLEHGQKHNRSVYFLGATDDVLSALVTRVKTEFPGLAIAGSHHGYFWGDEEKMVDQIKASNADMLFVAISSPKKEIFISKWRERLGVKFVMGVGGSFDVKAGKVKRAPVWMQNSGLEWFYRLVQEPRRMFMRYFISNSRFMVLMAKSKIKSLGK